jgi:3-oxoacyl-[acyl-carrier-protein] synthase III
MTRVSLAATASYLPERWMTAAEVGERSAIPEQVIVEKFGLRGKHIAAEDEHVSGLSVRGAERLLAEAGVDPESIDVVMYFGSMWKDYAVWQAAPWIAHRIGATRAYAVEYDNVSCGTPVALRIACDMLRAEDELRSVLVVAACRESYLLDYTNDRSRFMFNFGDGAVAGLLVKDGGSNELLGSHGITDGSLSLQVKLPSGGSVSPNGGYRYLDVDDPAVMKDVLDRVSLTNFVAAAKGALERSGATLADVGYLCGIHMKPSMHRRARRRTRPRRGARRVSRRHRPHERRRSAARPRPRGSGRGAAGGRARAPARGRHRLHVGRKCRTVGRMLEVGAEYGPSSWIEVGQDRIDAFADATGDHQWIHVDRERAAAGPFGGTIGHGYLTLSLLPVMSYEVVPSTEGGGMSVNYGLNRVRFPAPVPSGSRVRGTFRVKGIEEADWGYQATMVATVEREGADKPVCVAELVFRYYK